MKRVEVYLKNTVPGYSTFLLRAYDASDITAETAQKYASLFGVEVRVVERDRYKVYSLTKEGHADEHGVVIFNDYCKAINSWVNGIKHNRRMFMETI